MPVSIEEGTAIAAAPDDHLPLPEWPEVPRVFCWCDAPPLMSEMVGGRECGGLSLHERQTSLLIDSYLESADIYEKQFFVCGLPDYDPPARTAPPRSNSHISSYSDYLRNRVRQKYGSSRAAIILAPGVGAANSHNFV